MTQIDPRKPSRSRRRRTIVVLALLTPVVVVTVADVVLQVEAGRKLEGAIAEADLLDPGWRLADLLARRKPVPDDKNPAKRLEVAFRKLPAGWPESSDSLSFPRFGEPPEPATAPGSDATQASGSYATEAAEPAAGEEPPKLPARGMILFKELRKLSPSEPLTDLQDGALRAELEPLREAIAEARTLADTGEGHFDPDFGRIAIFVLLPHSQHAHAVGELLYLDALRRLQDGDLDGALESSRALLGAGRALGDEPVAITQVTRMKMEELALAVVVRTLARGEASDATLAALQKQLADEGSRDLVLTAMRGERAAYFDTFSRFASGELTPANLDGADATRSLRANPLAMALFQRAFYRYNASLALRLQTLIVEEAKLPLHEQGRQWYEYDLGIDGGQQTLIQRRLGVMVYLVLPLESGFVRKHYGTRAELRSTEVLVALERYRRARGSWPETLDALVPEYLKSMPRDPFIDAPVRYKRLDDGVSVYGIGFDHTDDGKFHPQHGVKHGYDSGARLWDPARRREMAGVNAQGNSLAQ
ncbi:MAG TPA: hypothetical protein VGZ22_05170 [Isosphaeraceae bacterium]|jgi:hypothetical protein|nr:hypothetical protein [Isosphaeraceae bacterium]